MNAHSRVERSAPMPGRQERPAPVLSLVGHAPMSRIAVARPGSVNLVAAAASLGIAAVAFGSFVYMARQPAAMAPRPMMVVQMMDLQPPPRPRPQEPTTAETAASTLAPVPVVHAPSVTVFDAPAMPVAAAVPMPVAGPVAVASAPVAASAPPASTTADAGDLSAQMIRADPPRYPIQSRRLREQGVVVLGVLLSADGRVMEIAVATSSGFERLDEAALRAVRHWRWSPMVRNGNPVLVRGMVTIPFVLRA